MRLKSVELLTNIRPPWSRDYHPVLIPRDGYELHYDAHSQTIDIMLGSKLLGMVHASQMRYAELYEEAAAITPAAAPTVAEPAVPEPEPTTPSLAHSAAPKRRGRPPKKPVE